MKRLLFASLIGILSFTTSFASQDLNSFSRNSTDIIGSDNNDEEDLKEESNDFNGPMYIPHSSSHNMCIPPKNLPSMVHNLIEDSSAIVDANEFIESTKEDLEKTKPDFLMVTYQGHTIQQSKKNLPLISQKLMKLLAEEIQNQLDSNSLTKKEKAALLHSLQEEFDRLSKTGEFDPVSYPTFWQILGTTFMKNVFFFTTEGLYQGLTSFVPIIKEVNLISLDVKPEIIFRDTKVLAPTLYHFGPKEGVAMGLNKGCEYINPKNIYTSLTPGQTTYDQIRSNIVNEHAPGGISRHSPIYNIIDKNLIPALVPVVCGLATVQIVSYLCGDYTQDITQPVALVSAFATKTLTEAAAQYATQRGGNIESGKTILNETKKIPVKLMNITLSGFKIASRGLKAIGTTLYQAYKGGELYFNEELEAHS